MARMVLMTTSTDMPRLITIWGCLIIGNVWAASDNWVGSAIAAVWLCMALYFNHKKE